jgi:accessory gene regulator protein AgrB
LKTLPLTIISYVSFASIRIYAKGWHASTKLRCNIESLFFFSFIPYFTQKTVMGFQMKLLIVITVFIILFLCAPQENSSTEKLNIFVEKIHKWKALRSLFILTIVCFATSSWLATGIIIGIVIEAIMVLPFTKTIIQAGGVKL